MAEIIAGIGFFAAFVGFVAVWINIGVYKGDTDRRLATVEDDLEKLSADEEQLEREVHGLQKETAGFIAGVRSDIANIKEMLNRIDKKIDGNGRG